MNGTIEMEKSNATTKPTFFFIRRFTRFPTDTLDRIFVKQRMLGSSYILVKPLAASPNRS